MREEKVFLARQKEEWRALIFRTPSRRRWGLVGLVLSFVTISFGLAVGAADPKRGNACSRPSAR